MNHISMDIVYVVIGIRAKTLIQNKIMVHKTVQALYKMTKKIITGIDDTRSKHSKEKILLLVEIDV